MMTTTRSSEYTSGHWKCPEVPRGDSKYCPPKTVKIDKTLSIRTGQFHWRAVCQAAEAGFTLLEVLLAMTILSVMMALAFTSVESILRAKKIIEDDQEIERLELVLIKRLSREFQLSYPGIPRLPPQDNLEQRFTSTETMLGEQGQLSNGRPGDTVTFVALSAGQAFLDDRQSNSGLVQLKYTLREDPERESQEDYPVFSLIREEIPYKRPFEKAYQEAIRFPLLDFAEGLQFEYFDLENNSWVREWGDEDRKDLPAMIRFTLYVRTPGGKERQIQGTVPLRARRRNR